MNKDLIKFLEGRVVTLRCVNEKRFTGRFHHVKDITQPWGEVMTLLTILDGQLFPAEFWLSEMKSVKISDDKITIRQKVDLSLGDYR